MMTRSDNSSPSCRASSVRFYALAATAIASLGGCVQLPGSGPSRSEVHEVAHSVGIKVVNVDYSITQLLHKGEQDRLFSEVFGVGTGNAEIVGPGDVLEISVWEAPPAVLFSSTLRQSTLSPGTAVMASSNAATFPDQMVGSEGTIDVPFAGRIMAAGKSLEGIESDIARQLQDKANKPQVLVRLVTNNTAYATVVGEVEKSTRMPLTPHGERLLDALAAAGGTKEPVGKITVQLTRGSKVQALSLETVIRDPQQNIPLRPGDVITVMYQPLSFTALGATGKSDEINFETKGISLSQALARVGGLNDNRANPQGVFIFRFEPKETAPNGSTVAATSDGRVPIIYRVDMTDPRAFFVAQNFPMADKDVLYVANAPGAELQKFINLLISTVYPIEGAVSITK